MKVLTPKQAKRELLYIKNNVHHISARFENWLVKKFGGNCWKKEKDSTGKFKQVFDNNKFQNKLCGYDVIEAVENYVKRYAKDIELVYCDDKVFSSSLLVIIPHPAMGVSTLFIPQNTSVTNRVFFYPNHLLLFKEAADRIISKHLKNTSGYNFALLVRFLKENKRKTIFLKMVDERQVQRNSDPKWRRKELRQIMTTACYAVCNSRGVIDWENTVLFSLKAPTIFKEHKFKIRQ